MMAYWGIAVNLLGNSLAGPPPAKDAQEAWEALEKARAIGAKTQRERDWIEALSAYYRDYDKVSVDDRLLAYTKAMEQMTQRYPDDFEAWAYLRADTAGIRAEDRQGLRQPAKIRSHSGKALQTEPAASGGIALSDPCLRLPAARRQGDRRRAALCRHRTRRAARPAHAVAHLLDGGAVGGVDRVEPVGASKSSSDYYHATDFMVYAHLQLAQDAKAKALIDEIYKAGRDDLLLKENLPNLASYTALAVIPARYPLERGDWKGAAALPAVPTKRLMADSLIRFTRGLGMARSGDVAGAKREIEAIQGLQKALLKAKDSYWAARSGEQVLAVSAWVAHAEGAREQAVKLMRSAADGEDGSVKHVAMENRLYPMRELFAELLLETGQAAPALREFEAALKENPNRYRGLYGAARAAEAAGDRKKAETYYAKFVAVSAKADTDRPEIAQAKTFLVRK